MKVYIASQPVGNLVSWLVRLAFCYDFFFDYELFSNCSETHKICKYNSEEIMSEPINASGECNGLNWILGITKLNNSRSQTGAVTTDDNVD